MLHAEGSHKKLGGGVVGGGVVGAGVGAGVGGGFGFRQVPKRSQMHPVTMGVVASAERRTRIILGMLFC